MKDYGVLRYFDEGFLEFKDFIILASSKVIKIFGISSLSGVYPIISPKIMLCLYPTAKSKIALVSIDIYEDYIVPSSILMEYNFPSVVE